VISSVLLVGALASSGCSSDGDHDGHDAATSPAPSASSSAAPEGGVPGALAAPVITGVPAMAGGMHVTWKNTQRDCDVVEGERRSGTEAYKVVFSVPGAADNKHDGVGLVAGTAYTYRLRCKKGDSASPYSDEKTGTP
jgi:hypothetical protein